MKLGRTIVAAALVGLAGACVSAEPVVAPAEIAPLPGPGPIDSAATASPAPPSVIAPVSRATVTIEPRAAEIVVAAHSLSGYWAVTGPKFIDFSAGVFSGVHIQYSADTSERDICIIDDDDGSLTGLCSTGIAKPATGHQDSDGVVLRWWNGPVNLIFTGTLDGASTIRGSLSGGVVGLSVTGKVPMTLTRLTPDTTAAPASADLFQAVLADLRSGTLSPGRYGPAALQHLQPALAEPWAHAAAPIVTYLGRIHIRWQKKQAEKAEDVFKVQNATDRRLCRIALDDKGIVADAECRGFGL